MSFVEHLPTSTRWGAKGQAPRSFDMDEYTNITFKFSSECLLRIMHSAQSASGTATGRNQDFHSPSKNVGTVNSVT